MSVLLPEAIEQMKHHEGVRQKPYLCPAHIWTVGVGRGLYHDQIKLPLVRKGEYTGQIRREYPIRLEDSRLWSMEEVDELLRELDIVGASMGLRRSDEYKRLKLLQDVDAIAADCRDLAVQHDLDTDTMRKVIMAMLDDQPVPLDARH